MNSLCTDPWRSCIEPLDVGGRVASPAEGRGKANGKNITSVKNNELAERRDQMQELSAWEDSHIGSHHHYCKDKGGGRRREATIIENVNGGNWNCQCQWKEQG